MKFYRYNDVVYHQIGVKVLLSKYILVKETPKGYWIKPEYDYTDDYKFWVSKDGLNRKAYPTKEQALINFKARKVRQISILKDRLLNAESAKMQTVKIEKELMENANS